MAIIAFRVKYSISHNEEQILEYAYPNVHFNEQSRRFLKKAIFIVELPA